MSCVSCTHTVPQCRVAAIRYACDIAVSAVLLRPQGEKGERGSPGELASVVSQMCKLLNCDVFAKSYISRCREKIHSYKITIEVIYYYYYRLL